MNTKSNQTRNLILLSMEAFAAQRYSEVGTLFAAACSSDDADDFKADLEEQLAKAILTETDDTALAGENMVSKEPKAPMSVIAAAVAQSMRDDDEAIAEAETSLSSDEEEDNDEDEEDSEEEDTEDEDDEDEEGEIPSSISSASKTSSKIVIAMSVKSPVGIKK